MGTAMSMELDADMEEALYQYEKGIFAELSRLSAAIEDLEGPNSTFPECTCCQERCPASKMIRYPCSHSYCSECLKALVMKSLRDDSLCPLQCCANPVKIADVEKLIGPNLAAKYEKRETEILDPDKTYCSDPRCSRYIPPAGAGSHCGVGKCKCGVETCRKCKQRAHGDLDDCARYFDGLLEELAKSKGWKRCPKCSRLIELEKGCYHIKCLCGTSWCYLCTGIYKHKHKTCACPAWDEGLIINGGEVW